MQCGAGVGWCTRGGVAGWVPGGCTGRGYTGTQPTLIPGPIFNHILKARAYLRPNEGNSKVIDEVSEIWSKNDPQIDPQIDPE